MASQPSIRMSPSLRRGSGRLQGSSCDSHKDQELHSLCQVLGTPPSMHRYSILKRHRASSVQDSYPSKVPRQEGRACIGVDSSEFETVEPADIPTPSTVEIFNDTRRAPIPDLTEDAGTGGPYGSNALPTKSSGCYAADTSGSSGSSQAKGQPARPFTPGNHDNPCDKHKAGRHCCSEALLKSDLSEDDVPDLSPNTYIYVRNLGLYSPDGSFSEHWANYPISFIPSTSKLGPRELDPGHYTCPYPGCVDPFGPCGRPDGYTGRDLTLHIYRHHGYGPAVDRVRLDIRMRVVALRHVQGKDSGDDPRPSYWKNPGRELARAMIGLVQDLEEVRGWERSRRVIIRRNEKTVSLNSATDNDKPALLDNRGSAWPAGKSDTKGKRKAVTPSEEDADIVEWAECSPRRHQWDIETELEVVDSPCSYARTNYFARLRDNRFERDRGASMLHSKEVLRSPGKTNERDDAGCMEIDR